MWFKELMGFDEVSAKEVRDKIKISGNKLISLENQKSYQFGSLQVATLKEFKELAPHLEQYDGKIKVNEVVANVQRLHCDPENKHALFQAASQFNLLEMVNPYITPEQGVAKYEYDLTQGPACAIACGAGTIFRNYFVPLENQIGQTVDKQIDCLDEIGKALNNDELELWKMRNGYALVSTEGLLAINKQLSVKNAEEREQLKELLKIGIQWDTEVTLADQFQLVSQAYCSALPIAYTHIESFYWESFARLVLEASYEATFYAALINYEKTGSNKLFLTLVGGGVFGNDLDWILEAIKKAIDKFKNTPLDVAIVSYGASKSVIANFIEELND